MSDIDLLSSSDFIEYVQRIGENLRESIPDNPDGLIKEIFNRLPSLETHSIQICLKILALLFEQCQISPTINILESLQRLAGLQCDVDSMEIERDLSKNCSDAIEAERCMINLLIRSSIAQEFYSENGVMDVITQRMKETNVIQSNDQMRLFDMRILGLLTKVNVQLRQRFRETFHGVEYLLEIIHQIILSKNDSVVVLFNDEIEYLIEILKTLENFILDLCSSKLKENHFIRLVSILRELILCSGSTNTHQTQIIHLLIQIPRMYYEHFLSPMHHQEKNIDVIDVLHDQLEVLMNNGRDKSLFDVLELLILMCQSNRIIRRYCRVFVLSIIDEDVQSLGEKLIDCIHHSNIQLKTLSTKFLFILCKENVNQLMEYTGMKNMKKTLDHLGISHRMENENYSSDSDQFDMENDEYLERTEE